MDAFAQITNHVRILKVIEFTAKSCMQKDFCLPFDWLNLYSVGLEFVVRNAGHTRSKKNLLKISCVDFKNTCPN
jgi:hypothetical protein